MNTSMDVILKDIQQNMQTAPHGFNALTVFLGAPITATWDKPSVHSVRV